MSAGNRPAGLVHPRSLAVLARAGASNISWPCPWTNSSGTASV